jgi:hypothetical protein
MDLLNQKKNLLIQNILIFRVRSRVENVHIRHIPGARAHNNNQLISKQPAAAATTTANVKEDRDEGEKNSLSIQLPAANKTDR